MIKELTARQEECVRVKDYVLYALRKSFLGNTYAFINYGPNGYRPSVFASLDSPYLFVGLANRGGGTALLTRELILEAALEKLRLLTREEPALGQDSFGQTTVMLRITNSQALLTIAENSGLVQAVLIEVSTK